MFMTILKDASSILAGSPDKKASSSDELKLKEAMGNLAAGKRNLLINDISGAVSSFAEACKVGILVLFDSA